MIGHVAAGEPILAVENIESYFPIPAEFMPNAQTFILNVVGESMINAGILDGDKVIVEQTLSDCRAGCSRFYGRSDPAAAADPAV